MNVALAGAIHAPAGSAAHLVDRADLFFCLSRAFMPPPAPWSVCDWSQPLLDDLEELAVALDLDVKPLRAALQRECARWAEAARRDDGSADSWLVEYTRLFLVPPVPVPLNAGMYLEGSLAGAASQMIRSCYEVAGFLPHAGFHDLPDHVAMQLEFLAVLYERVPQGEPDCGAMAEEFAREFIHGWGIGLEHACAEAACGLPAAAVYRELARLMRQAVVDPTL